MAGFSLGRHKRFAAASIATLSLGVAVTTVFFALVHSIVLRPLPFPDADRLVAISQRELLSEAALAPVSFPQFEDWRESRTLDAIAALRRRPATVRHEGISEPVSAGVVSASLFPMLGVEVVAGRGFLEGDDRPGTAAVVILSAGFWRERFGEDGGVVGGSLDVDGRPCLIVGVVGDLQLPQVGNAEIWLPLSVGLETERQAGILGDRGQRFLSVIGRVGRQENVEAVEAELSAIVQGGGGVDQGRAEITVARELQDAVVGAGTRSVLIMLFAASGLVLLLSCVNATNLFGVRFAARRRELATRIALGCGPGEVFVLLLAETGAVSCLAGGMGLLLAMGVQKMLWQIAPEALPRMHEVEVGLGAAGFTTACCAAIAVALAAGGAFGSTRFNPQEWLGEAGGDGVTRRPGWRYATIGVEVGLCVVLVVGTGLSLRSLWNVGGIDRGFVGEGVLTMRIDPPATVDGGGRSRLYEEVLRRVAVLPGVERAGATQSVPLGGSMWTTSFRIVGQPRSRTVVTVNYARVAGDYFEAMRIPLERGRYIGWRDHADAPRVAVVNSAFSRQFAADGDILGDSIEIWPEDPPSEVVGVVRNAIQGQLEVPPAPMIYIPYSQRPRGAMTIVVKGPESQRSLLMAVGREIGRLSPQAGISRVASMEQLLDGAVVWRRSVALVLIFFGSMALALSGMGIYSVTAYVVSCRSRELGLRVALGATPASVVNLVLRQSVWATCFGVAGGVGVAAACSGFVGGVFYGVTPTDAATLSGVAAFVTATTVLSAYGAAQRASEVDPMVAVRGGKEARAGW